MIAPKYSSGRLRLRADIEELGDKVRLVFVRPHESIVACPSTAELSDFIVLSGPNGSGKSQLLAAIAAGAVQIEGVPQQTIRHLRLGQLVPTGGEQQPYGAHRESWARVASVIESERGHVRASNLGVSDAELEPQLRSRLRDAHRISDRALDAIVRESGKPLMDVSREDVRRFAPILFDSSRELFQWSVTELFLKYHELWEQNEQYMWRNAERGTSFAVLTNEEFLTRYGPPPWELFNETLAEIGLPYRLPPVVPADGQSLYNPLLTDTPSGVKLTTSQLSSGEQTLLAIAMSLYSASHLTSAIELPGALLLDEADASLHPSMAQVLLRVLERTFVGRHGIKVVLTTHSPTTVALADEQSLYIMRRQAAERLRKAGRDTVLSSLTVGLPTLSIKIENRRQVVVESEHDEGLYGELYGLVRPALSSPVSLEFIASGRGGQGNSAAVSHLVAGLRGRGNESIWGIVDRDKRQGAQVGIVYCSERYAIENPILDPLAIAVFLYRERLVEELALGLPERLLHTEIKGEYAVSAAAYVVGKLSRPGDDPTPVGVAYSGGSSLQVPSYWLNINGKDLVSRLKEAWPPLHGYRNLMAEVVAKVYRDLPQYIPADVLVLFGSIIAAEPSVDLPDSVGIEAFSELSKS